jgi:hypothetical protein
MNGTVTISLEDFKALEDARTENDRMKRVFKERMNDLDTIFECIPDMKEVAQRYNALEKDTYLTLKADGWNLVKRQSSK